MSEQLLHQIDVTALFIYPLRKGLAAAVRDDLAVQTRSDKRFLEQLVSRLTM